MEDKKHFWQSASNWGFLGGMALFVVNLVGWGLKLDHSLVYELLMFAVICSLVVVTGRRNAAAAGDAGYSYGRAVGFIFAMMLFAGVVYGVGRFLMTNFIALEYYNEINGAFANAFVAGYNASAPVKVSPDQVIGWMRNPFVLIFAGVWEMVFKGGFLGLVAAAFFVKKPDIFGGGQPETAPKDEQRA